MVKPIEHMSNIALIGLYRDTVVDWWEHNEDFGGVHGILLERIEKEMRKRMKSYDSTTAHTTQ